MPIAHRMTSGSYTFTAVLRAGNLGIRLVAAVTLLLWPAGSVCIDLRDPNLGGPGIPARAWELHRDLSPNLEQWAKARIASGRAEQLSTSDISGTEWPLFGAVFYLWATESLQDAWLTNTSASAQAPKDYAKGAIEAATRLVIDPAQASWVKTHWGTNYLHRENLFYRMLIISALTSHARLTGSREFFPLLADQAGSLSAELDDSASGLLDDYPGECYPGDVLAAVAMIRKADSLLGTDRSAFAKRALRGFQGRNLDERSLPPYAARAQDGAPLGPSRGCANSYMALTAPMVWPEQARRWYDLHTQFFWQEQWGGAGFREFPKDMPGRDWYADVDSGPVVKGFGFAACAFGLGAARTHGRFDHALPLAAETLAFSWPLPNGVLLLPRLLSNAADAPLLGEAGILYNLTRQPAAGFPVRSGGKIPAICFVILTLQLATGVAIVWWAVAAFRRHKLRLGSGEIALPGLQFSGWLLLLSAALLMVLNDLFLPGFLFLLICQLLPRRRKSK